MFLSTQVLQAWAIGLHGTSWTLSSAREWIFPFCLCVPEELTHTVESGVHIHISLRVPSLPRHCFTSKVPVQSRLLLRLFKQQVNRSQPYRQGSLISAQMDFHITFLIFSLSVCFYNKISNATQMQFVKKRTLFS